MGLGLSPTRCNAVSILFILWIDRVGWCKSGREGNHQIEGLAKMGRKVSVLPILPLFLFFAFVFDGIRHTAHGDEKNRRETAVRQDRQNLTGDARWLYNDVESGFLAAKKLDKPLLIVLRCVPCKACTGIDESVLRAKQLQSLLDDFVCVRLINANAIDLSKFQFDYDLSFSTLIFHPDGTLIARYGSWQHQLDELEASTVSLEATLRRSLELFKDWGTVEPHMTAKQGGETPFALPIEIPGLAGKYERELKWDGNVVQSCVHCHQIGDAYRAWYRKRGEQIPEDLIYPMPDPRVVGLRMDQRSGIRIQQVESDSIAETAGLKSGDEVIKINQTPIVSLADIAWALHREKNESSQEWTVNRDGNEVAVRVLLPDGWRNQSDISARVGTWQMRAMVLGGMVLRTLDPKKRSDLGLESNDLGLIVHGLGEYGEHAAAKNAGFRKGDVVLRIEGINTADSKTGWTESELIGKLLSQHTSPTKLACTVLRDNQRIELAWPIQ